ncbi:hypothetical protein Ahy_A09g043955 [Arachis hypogaea]|uniref:Uncharacterized protein n=1 Tax=Arachis hypogaea TaxID=3818 RepID=A0A445BJB6_ARAHY|nr:hypothetical protein Ahy_A09g043955 [Arachis hypogaea]
MSTTKKRVHDEMVEQNQKQIAHRKSIDTFGRRTSQYRGIGGLVDMKLIYVQTGPFDGVVRLKPCFDVTGRYGWNIVAKFRGSNVDIGGDELVRGHYNKETKNCVRACYLYCLKTCIKCLEKEYRALCKLMKVVVEKLMKMENGCAMNGRDPQRESIENEESYSNGEIGNPYCVGVPTIHLALRPKQGRIYSPVVDSLLNERLDLERILSFPHHLCRRSGCCFRHRHRHHCCVRCGRELLDRELLDQGGDEWVNHVMHILLKMDGFRDSKVAWIEYMCMVRSEATKAMIGQIKEERAEHCFGGFEFRLFCFCFSVKFCFRIECDSECVAEKVKMNEKKKMIFFSIFSFLLFSSKIKPWYNCHTCRTYLNMSWTTHILNPCDWYIHLLCTSPTKSIHFHVFDNITSNPDMSTTSSKPSSTTTPRARLSPLSGKQYKLLDIRTS